MGSTGDTTVTSQRGVGPRAASIERVVPAIVILWSDREPHRVGEVALLEGTGPWVVGRKSDDLDQVAFVRQRIGKHEHTGALTGDSLSRRQLVIQEDEDGITIANVGKGRLLVNGDAVQRETIADGDVFEIAGHYLFFLTSRPPRAIATQHVTTLHAFGEADAWGIVGESPATWKLRDDLGFVAAANAHVLVRGASGTGKELAAAAIHGLSTRARSPFVSENCANFSPGLMASELFGNERGYPNPGMPERPGLLGAADGGTLMFDEIGELPHELQAQLLRFFDSGRYHRVGDAREREADVRFIGATNRPASALKHDLFARFQLAIEMPGLVDRREDIPLHRRTSPSPRASVSARGRNGLHHSHGHAANRFQRR